MGFLLKRADKDGRKADDELLMQIREVERLILCTENCFSTVNDEDLIEACIYERESLIARYRFLLNAAKIKGLSISPFFEKTN